MYLPTTHAFFGILAAGLAGVLLGIGGLLHQELFILGVIFGILSDVDYVYYLGRHGLRPAKYSHEHRQALTHSFFPHLLISIILFFLWGKLYGLIYFFAVVSHLLLDSVHRPWGIRWLWPFSQKYYSIGIKSGLTVVTKKELDEYTEQRGDQPWFKRFVRLKNPYFVFEIVASLFFVLLVYFILKG